MARTSHAFSTRAAPVSRAPSHGDGWISKAARFGYIAKAVVYALVGVLAVRLALGETSQSPDPKNAIRELGAQPFGQVLLAITALGLLCFAVWRFTEAAVDPDRRGSDAKGVVQRMGLALSGAIYLGLAWWTASIVLGSGSGSGGGGGQSQETWTASLLAQPFGRWLVGIVGAVVAGIGVYHFVRAYRASFMEKYDRGAMRERTEKAAKWVGRFGLSARGVTFLIIGGFFAVAAWQHDPQEAGGLGEALSLLLRQPYGAWLLGVVALGFVAYGGYCVMNAMYRRFAV